MQSYVALVIFVRLLGAASTFILSLVVARALGVETAGQFILSINAVLFLAILARQGADSLALKVVAVLAAQSRVTAIVKFLLRQTRKTLLLSVPICLLILASLTFLAFPDQIESYRSIWIWFSPALVFLTIMGVLSMSFQALDQALWAIVFQALGINLVVIIAAQSGIDTAYGLAAALCFASMGLVFFGILQIRRTLNKIEASHKTVESDFDVGEQDELQVGRAFWTIAILQNLQVWGAHYLAGVLLPSTELSALVIAQQCSLTLTLVLQAVIMVYAPKFAILHNAGKKEELQRLCQKVVLLITAAVAPPFLVLVAFPTQILAIFGTGFDAGSTSLRILALGQLLNAMTGPVGMVLMMAGQERGYRTLLVVAVPAALLLAVALGVTMGMVGFAVATALALASTNFVAVLMVRRRLGISPTPWF